MRALAVLALASGLAATAGAVEDPDKIPITTNSDEARRTYLEARELAENLRVTDANKRYADAVAKDPGFALAHLGKATTSASAKEFFDELGRAVAGADKVSEPERLLILAQDANAKSDPTKQRELLTKLVGLRPNDERAHNALANFYFGTQDYNHAIEEYKKASTINARFAQPLNQMGYAYRFIGDNANAEATFKRYIELIPNDPNPYDSYAELLMKVGRFAESITSYEKALTVDKNFVQSYIGIGNNYMFMDRGADARAAFARLTTVARNDGERRQALFWTAVSYLHEGATDKALAEVRKEAAIAEAAGDLGNLSADHNFMANILIAAGKPDQAQTELKQEVEIIGRASVPAQVKETTTRNAIADEARVALARKDLATARARAQAYATAAAAKGVAQEIRRGHELAGLIAIAEKKYDVAVTELEQASQQDPRVLYNLAVALRGKGDLARARTECAKAADWNALGVNYAYVRREARALKGRLSSAKPS
jgi:tetratricopeptide (TPR) repeat protein